MKTILIILTLLIGSNLYSQNKKDIIKGNIKAVYEEVLPGVNVCIYKDDRFIIGTASDINGNYKIYVPDTLVEFKIVFSYLGFKTKEIIINREKKENEKSKKH